MISASPSADDSLVMLSALQHWLFCKRQCALIHLEQVWEENRLTASGRVLHERVDERKSETRRTLRQATAVRLVSRRLGIWGIADMVEFHLTDAESAPDGTKVAARLPGLAGFWRPFPVEYKRGKPKSHRADEVQLCAQAICLEEMLGVSIPDGALFYGEPRRRTDVTFDTELRSLTEDVARGVHALIALHETPPPSFGKWCASCSLIEECRPKLIATRRSAKVWLSREMETAET
jgi:CRISPR-associated exonuclease Cas4